MDNASDSSFDLLGSSTCGVCQGFGDMSSPRGALVDIPEEQQGRGRYLYMYMHHPSVAALARSAKAGCSICKVIRYELRSLSQAEFDRKAAATVSPALTTATTLHSEWIMNTKQSDDDTLIATQLAKCAKLRDPLKILDLGNAGKGRIVIEHFACDKPGPRGTTGKFHVEVYVVNSNFLKGSLSGFQNSYDQFDPDLKHRPSRHLLSDPHISLIKNWRDTCEEKHASCRTNACDQQLPSRVLELDPNKEDEVRLIETHGMKGQYACLSYCWGVSKTQAGQTKRSNLSNHLQRILLNDLPKTIAESIHLCNKLGFRYLWIDRLCIIQDDTEDWATEASKMCDIYSRSELTISVPICSKSSQSPVQQRHKWWFLRQSQFGTMEFTDEKSNLKSSLWLYIRHLRFRPWIFEEDWTHFRDINKDESHWLGRGWTFQEWILSPRVLHIDSMTIWDCFNGYANELSQRGMRETYLIRNPREFGRGIFWGSMVEEYSKRGIAYEKDRLPALAGLAERYHQATHHTYLAGMWLEEMPFSLLWEPDPYGSADRRPPPNQTTPSWSWAHWNGPVNPPLTNRGTSAEASIESHYCRYEPPSSFSTVVEAWIDVDGSLSDVTRTRCGEPGTPDELLVGNEWWLSYPDDKCWDMDDAVKQRNIKLLLIASPKQGHEEYSALMLQRSGSNDVSPLCFRRVGIATQEESESKKPIEEPLWKKQVVRLI